MRALVCGGRDFNDQAFVDSVLDEQAPTEICHGAARGADTLAGKWATKRNVPCRVFPADWQRDGNAAGPLRNAEMLREFKPDTIIAFPGGRGTADMVRRAKRADCVRRIVEASPRHRPTPPESESHRVAKGKGGR